MWPAPSSWWRERCWGCCTLSHRTPQAWAPLAVGVPPDLKSSRSPSGVGLEGGAAIFPSPHVTAGGAVPLMLNRRSPHLTGDDSLVLVVLHRLELITTGEAKLAKYISLVFSLLSLVAGIVQVGALCAHRPPCAGAAPITSSHGMFLTSCTGCGQVQEELHSPQGPIPCLLHGHHCHCVGDDRTPLVFPSCFRLAAAADQAAALDMVLASQTPCWCVVGLTQHALPCHSAH